VNTALAASFKAGWQQTKGGSLAAMDGTTMNEDEYVACSTHDLLRARQPNKKPPLALTHTVCPPGKLMETVSHEQRHFQQPRQDILKAERVDQPRPGMEMGGAAIDPPKRTTMFREYGKDGHCIYKSASSPKLEGTKAEKEEAKNIAWNVLNIRRNPYMSPGQ